MLNWSIEEAYLARQQLLLSKTSPTKRVVSSQVSSKKVMPSATSSLHSFIALLFLLPRTAGGACFGSELVLQC